MADLLAIILFVYLTGFISLALWGRILFRSRLITAGAGGQLTLADGGSDLLSSLASQIPTRAKADDNLQRDLLRAGYYGSHARRDFLAFRNGLTLLTMVACAAMAAITGPDNRELTSMIVAIGLAITLICWALPRLALQRAAAARVERIRRGMPDALDMMSMCLSGGMTVKNVLEQVARELYFAHADVAIELQLVCQQAEMSTLDVALTQFARRVDASEVVSLSAMITQGNRLGTDVVSTVHEYADMIRNKTRHMADEKASKAQVKLLFPLVLCLVPSVFLIIWGPAIVELLTFVEGLGETTPESLIGGALDSFTQ